MHGNSFRDVWKFSDGDVFGTNRGGTGLFLEAKVLSPRHGFEPRFTAPKAAVLPLDDRGSLGEWRAYASV
jgi:hypothetical protein